KEDGYDILRLFSEKQPETRFVLMTGYESAAGALDALAYGAYDYLVKPFSMSEILSLAESVRKQHQLRKEAENSNLVDNPPVYISNLPLIGRSPSFVKCLKMVGRVAPTNLPVLITG